MLIIPVNNAQAALVYIDELREAGLRSDVDFTWSYVPSEYDGWDDSTHTQPCLEVKFINEALESFYSLRWT